MELVLLQANALTLHAWRAMDTSPHDWQHHSCKYYQVTHVEEKDTG